jgi:hypothetical protein
MLNSFTPQQLIANSIVLLAAAEKKLKSKLAEIKLNMPHFSVFFG